MSLVHHEKGERLSTRQGNLGSFSLEFKIDKKSYLGGNLDEAAEGGGLRIWFITFSFTKEDGGSCLATKTLQI